MRKWKVELAFVTHRAEVEIEAGSAEVARRKAGSSVRNGTISPEIFEKEPGLFCLGVEYVGEEENDGNGK